MTANGALERVLPIVNDLGLHARAATKFVQTANRFPGAEVEVEKDGQVANGKSIMGLLMLVAAKGTEITVRTRGAEAAPAMAALAALVASRFGEDR